MAVLIVALAGGAAYAPRASAYIYWTDNGGIERANLDGSGSQQLVPNLFLPGIAVDGSHVYWFNGGGIGRANLDGSSAQEGFITPTGALSNSGLAVDGQHIYWGTYDQGSGTNGIGRANLDGSNVDGSFITGLSRTSQFAGVSPHIAVDSAHIYWANTNFNYSSSPITSTIGRANLDGSGVDDSFITVVNGPTALAVGSGHLYWGTYDNSTGTSAIVRDGQTLITIQPSQGIDGLAVHSAHIYWNDCSFIARANLDGSNIDPRLIDLASGSKCGPLAVDDLGPGGAGGGGSGGGGSGRGGGCFGAPIVLCSGYPSGVTTGAPSNISKIARIPDRDDPSQRLSGIVSNLSSSATWHFEFRRVGERFTCRSSRGGDIALDQDGAVKAGCTPTVGYRPIPGKCCPNYQKAAVDIHQLRTFTPYEFRLVAIDKHPPGHPVSLTGKWQPFVPENLTNPIGFSPAGKNPPAKYSLSIKCLAGCFQIAAATFGYVTPTEPLRVDGEISIDSFDQKATLHGSGKLWYLDGDWERNCLSIGGPQECLDKPTTNGKTRRFIVDGSIELGVAKLDFTPDHSFCLIGCDTILPFSLEGAVQYGTCGPFDHQCAGTSGYQSLLGGSAGSGTWTVCFQTQPGAGAQVDCNPPDHPDKFTAGLMSGGATVVGLFSPDPISKALGVFSAITGALSLDPPDRRYMRVTRPPKFSVPSVETGHGLSRRAAAAATRILRALAPIIADGRAYLDALQRYQGAELARNPQGLVLQYRALLQYGRALAFRCLRAATVIAAERRALSHSPLGSSRIAGSEIERRLRDLRHHGLSGAVVRQLQRLGVTSATIRALRKLIPKRAPATARTPLGPILAPQFAAELRAFAKGLLAS